MRSNPWEIANLKSKGLSRFIMAEVHNRPGSNLFPFFEPGLGLKMFPLRHDIGNNSLCQSITPTKEITAFWIEMSIG